MQNRAARLSIVLPLWLLGSPAPAQTTRNYSSLPLSFERQQAVPGAVQGEQYVARGQGYAIAVQGEKIFIGASTANGGHRRTVSLEFAGARSPRAVPGGMLPGKVNHIHGNDPAKWQMGQSAYERVTYKGIYPGIDVVYYGNQRHIEFDLVLNPGANPRAIRMKVGGAEKLSLDSAGALVIGGPGGDLRIALPKIYQEVNGAQRAIAGRYVLRGGNEVAFHVEPYDRSRPLVIDPTIVYSTLLGGTTGASQGQGIAVDSAGNMYVAGYTSTVDFPVANAYQGGAATGVTGQAGFVSKINAAGTAFLYSTYITGGVFDQFQGIAVDSTGAAWVAGYTQSTSFPVVNAIQSTFLGGGTIAVVLKLKSSGALVFSTYLGGGFTNQANGVAVDSSGNAYVTGSTDYALFPASPGAFQSANQGNQDAFVVKFSSAGSLIYATSLGGAGNDSGYGIAADSQGNAYVTGSSTSATFPGAPAGGAQPANAGGGDAFAAKLNPAGTALVYFTFFGGTAADQGNAITVDSTGDAYIAGYTGSPGLATAGAAQTVIGGGSDGFIAKLNPGGTAFTWVTYLGGNRQDQINGAAVDGSGNVYVAGQTESTNFPVQSAVQSAIPGGGVTLFQTIDSGALWSAFDTNIPGAVLDLSADPQTSGTIVVATEQGIYRTTDNGVSWTQQLAGPFGAASLSRSPAASGTIYAAAAGSSAPSSNVYLSTDGGVTWKLEGAFTGYLYPPSLFDAGGIIADPLTAETAYAFTFGDLFGIQKTTDAGKSWKAASAGLPYPIFITSMAAAADGSLYLVGNGGIFKSTNQAASWVRANTGLPQDGLGLRAHTLGVSAADPSTLYVVDASQPAIYKTTNGGTSWNAVSPTPGYQGVSEPLGVDVSPLDSSIVYASGVFPYLSIDGGTTWTYAGTGLTPSAIVNNFAFDPLNSTHVFAIEGASTAGFAAKLNSSGTAFAWSTYLGDAGGYSPAIGVATDGAGHAFVTGRTSGHGFPTTTSAFQSSLVYYNGAFVTEISDATSACAYTIGPAAQVVSGGGQVALFTVVAPSGCTWTAVSNQAWATIPSGASGTGSGTVYVQTGTNATGASRSATLTIGGQTATLTQADSSCSYELNPVSVPVPAAGGPGTVNLTTGSGCPWSLVNGSEAVSITSGASGTGNGVIVFTVAPNGGPSARSFVLSVLGMNPIISISQAAGPSNGGPAPSILPAGIVPVFSTVNTVQPGSWASIYGTNLGENALWNGDFPTKLGGTSITVNNVPAYLWFVSPGQINFQVPDAGTSIVVDVVVTTPSGSVTSTVGLEAESPSFSLLDATHVAGIIPRPDGMGAYGSGAGSYDILGPTGTSLGYQTVAAKAGDVVELFGVGFGPTNPFVPAGQAFNGTAAPVVDQISLQIGSQKVVPGFAALTEAGLYQFNVTIPAGAGAGDVPLIASVLTVVEETLTTPAKVVISLQ